MKNKTVVFDWNGTLFDDIAHTLRATNVILEHLGHKPVTLEHYREHCQIPLAHMYKAFGVDMDEMVRRKEEIHEMWISAYDSGAKKAALRPGVNSMLRELNERGNRTVILSNHTVENISGHVRRLDVHGHFEAILAYDHYGAAFTKNVKGERLKTYIEGRRIEHGVIVGDTEEEIDIARAHGLISVAVTGGVVSEQRLKQARPDFLIHDFGEIPAITGQVFGPKRRSA